MRLAKILVSVVALASATPLVTEPAEAGRRRMQEPRDGYVVAHSRHGNGTVTGAVRVTSVGAQVQLPGGHWEYCRRSCSETLRVQSIDFNQGDDIYLGKGTIGNECGIFGCLDVGF